MRHALLLPLAAAAAALTVHGSGPIVGTQKADVLVGGKGADSIEAAFGGRDTVRCGRGRDVVAADLGDRVAADCEVVSRRLSVDTTTNPRGQHETAVEPDSFAAGSTVVAAFQLGRIESGAAAAIGTAVSTDAGRTWRRAVLPSLTADSRPPGPEASASDPTVARDAAHGVWLVGALALDRGGTRIVVSRSPDGLGWSAPVTVATGPLLDKDWFACDNGEASPYRGRCYATYSDDAQNRTVVQWSDDGGVTWSAPVRAGGLLVGTQPVIRPDGTLVIVAGDYANASGLSGSLVALVSHDGGATFASAPVAKLRAASGAPLRAIPLPSVDVDSTGRIYAVWEDCRFHPGCSGNDLVLSTSTDGTAWTPPTRIVGGLLPGVAADPEHPGRLGLVYAAWHPGSCRTACLLDVSFVSSPDGGRTWSASQRLSPRPMPPAWLARSEGGRMVGDYFSTSIADTRFVPVFTLALPPLGTRFREAIFAASLP